MSTLEEFNGAVEAGLYNKFTRYGKMTMNFYHNEQFIFKIYSYKTFFKQGSDETLFLIAFTMQTIHNILNNSGKNSFISF